MSPSALVERAPETVAPAALADAHQPVMVGVDHHAATLDVRERLAAAVADLPGVTAHLLRHAREAVVLSTCNRTEIYLAGADLGHAVQCLAGATGIAEEAFVDCLAARAGLDAATHLFAVAAGLESQLLGETQILGQVRDAYFSAREAGGVGTTLGTLFRHALAVGKRARAQTGISRGAASVGSAAAAILREEMGAEIGHVVVVGAGEAAERVLAHLRSLKIGRVDVANRTVARAEELVAAPGRALAMDELAATLAEADAVVCATAAPHAVLHARDVAAAMARRDGRRLVLLDLAVPRDVEAAAGSIPGARLYDIDEVQGHAAASIERRAGEVARVRELVEAQVGSFEEWLAARRAARQIRRLRERAEELRQEEVRRVAGRLSDAERAAVDQATRAVVRSLLHGPTVALRRGGESQVGELLASAFARTRLRDGLDHRPGE